jgi:hypothetical protein
VADVVVVVDDAAVKAFVDGPVTEEIALTAGAAIAAGAKRRAPVRTGRLRDSIAVHVVAGDDGPFTVVSAIFYDLFQERPARQVREPARPLIDAMHHDMPKLL